MPSHLGSKTPNFLNALVQRLWKQIRVSLKQLAKCSVVSAVISGDTFQCGKGVLDGPGEIRWLFGQISVGFPKFACSSVLASPLQNGSRTFGVAQSLNSTISEVSPLVWGIQFTL